MADDDGILFSERAARRVADAVRKVEAMAPTPRHPTRTIFDPEKHFVLVRVTSQTIDGTSGYWPGLLQQEKGDGTYIDFTECWVKNLVPGDPAVDDHWARFFGYDTTDGKPIYELIAAAGEATACTPVVTAVACVNGQLAVTTQYITGDFVVSDEPCGGIGPPIKPALGGLGDPTDPVKPTGGGTNSLSTGGGGLDALLGGGTGGATDPKDCMAYATQECMASYGYYNATCIQTMYWHCMGRGHSMAGGFVGGVQSFNGIGPALGPPLGGGQAMPIDSGELAAALLTAGGVNVVASADLTGQTALGNILVYGTGTALGSYLVTAYLNVASGTGLSFNVSVTWTDENNAGQTVVISPTIVAAGVYALAAVSIRAHASSNITVFTTGAMLTISFDASAEVIQTR